jgi:hypothetical protein
MCDHDAVQTFEAQPRFHDLPLGALAAIDQEAMFIVHYHLGGKAAARRRSGCRSA